MLYSEQVVRDVTSNVFTPIFLFYDPVKRAIFSFNDLSFVHVKRTGHVFVH